MMDTIIIGAGQAGLATGYYLSKTSLDYLILDANPQIGGSWQHYWDSLQVFSPAKYSKLPGLDFPGDSHRYPTRDEVIAYLQDYAAHFDMPIMTDKRVSNVNRHDGQFTICTDDGQTYQTSALVVATGAFNKPYIPDIPGMEQYRGHITHSFDYREPSPFKDQRIVVVGANNSAIQVGVELATVADVTLAIRRPIQWMPKRILGKSVFFWFHDTGFDTLPLGYVFDLQDVNYVLDDGTYQQAIESGSPNTKQMFDSFTEQGIIWADGLSEAIDTVVFATGYRPDNMPFLRGLNALDSNGLPYQRGGVSTVVSGLYFMGLFGQRSAASATLRGVGKDAKVIVNHIWRYLMKPEI